MSELLPHDIVEIILSRLSVRSLLQFKCVCKTWYNSITSLRFVLMHLNQTIYSKNNKLLLHCRGTAVDAISLSISEHGAIHQEPISSPFDKTIWKFQNIIGSCNWLLCMVDMENATLLNLSTRKYWELPFHLHEYQSSHSSIVDFTQKFKNRYGFWYDEKVNDYKILVVEFPSKGVVNVVAYSLAAESWTRIHENISVADEMETAWSDGIWSNGAMHWVGKSSILAFDCENNGRGLYKLPFPDNGPDMDICSTIDTFQNHLCMFYCHYDENAIYGWMMEEYGGQGSWIELPTLMIPNDITECANILLVAYRLLLNGAKEESVIDLLRQKIITYKMDGHTYLDSLSNY